MEEYCTGIDQPAKSTIRPPWDWCQVCNGVIFSGEFVIDAVPRAG